MYGFIHCCLADMVIGGFGEEKWKEIIEKAGVELDGGSYLIHRIYSDSETLNLVGTACEVLGFQLNDVLEKFGEHFFRYTVQSGYDRILRVLGRNLQDFLCNLDALHDHLAHIYPGMEAPSFRCTEGDDGALLLHYYSRRSGLESIVIGLVKTICTDVLNIEVSIKIIATKGNGCDHSIFAIYEIKGDLSNKSKLGLQREELTVNGDINANCVSETVANNPMNVMSFCKAFPFHVMFDEDLTVIQAGVAILRVLNKKSSNKVKFNELFTLVRPKLTVSFAPILAHINTVFVVETTEGSIICGPESKGKNPKIRLKGQMVHVPESRALLFLCSPRVADLDALRTQGLFLSDLPLHDATRDLIFTSHTRTAERELVEQLEETSNNLKKMEARLIDDKMRTDDLLHSILPPNVAEKLRVNEAVEAENYKLVSILFSDIVGFTALCSNDKVVPMDIVRMLNKLYTYFDMLSGINEVYKVETIGDAYMVVGGLPKPCDNHAERVLNMAFGMMEASLKVIAPSDKLPLKIRIGVHSGPVMAGVVGKKMPRYCLFGSTVGIANKAESGSKPGFINVSIETRKYLKESDYKFEPNTNPTPIPCFYVFRSPLAARKPTIVDIMSSVPAGYGGLLISPMASPRGGTPIRQSPSSSPPGTPPKQRKKKLVQMCANVDSFPIEEIAANLNLADALQDA